MHSPAGSLRGWQVGAPPGRRREERVPKGVAQRTVNGREEARKLCSLDLESASFSRQRWRRSFRMGFRIHASGKKDADVNERCPNEVLQRHKVELKKRAWTPYVFAKRLPREGTRIRIFAKTFTLQPAWHPLERPAIPDGGLHGPHEGPSPCSVQGSDLHSSTLPDSPQFYTLRYRECVPRHQPVRRR